MAQHVERFGISKDVVIVRRSKSMVDLLWTLAVSDPELFDRAINSSPTPVPGITNSNFKNQSFECYSFGYREKSKYFGFVFEIMTNEQGKKIYKIFEFGE